MIYRRLTSSTGLNFCSFVLAAVALCGCQAGTDLDAIRRFEAAEQAFVQADSADEFLRAAAIYQEIADSGVDSGVVYFNQGNAFMKADERGRAIAAYRKGQRLRPRDPLIDANLRTALNGRAPERSLFERVCFWQNSLSYREKFFITTVLLVASALCSILAKTSASADWLRRVSVGLFVPAVVFAVSSAYDWYRFDHLKHGVAITEVVARKGNSDRYEPAFTKPLAAGAEFVVKDQQSGWVEVSLPQADAWVPAETVVVY